MTRTSAEDLFDRHAVAVYRYFRRATRRPDVAEDLTQEVFVRIVRGMDRYRAADREVHWVFRIARNVLIDHWAKGGAAEVALTDAAQPAAEPVHVLALGFQEALDLLPHADREVYLLHEQAGLSYREIAETAQITEEAVRSRLYRARQHVRRLLSGRLFTNNAEGR